VPGPGADFFWAVASALGGLPFIAEDLGIITPDVSALRDQFGIPGTKVLQFGFEGDKSHLPENFSANTVVYTGTHDNATTREWYEQLRGLDRKRLLNYLQRPDLPVRDAAPEMIRLAWSSRARLAIAPLQDLLNLGSEGRMNVPGQAAGNWRWRATEHMLSARNFEWLSELTNATNRVSPVQSPVAEVSV
jgi:4-alpha-glucanotransferase